MIVVYGKTNSGKTTLGQKIAKETDARFFDDYDLVSTPRRKRIAKMLGSPPPRHPSSRPAMPNENWVLSVNAPTLTTAQECLRNIGFSNDAIAVIRFRASQKGAG